MNAETEEIDSYSMKEFTALRDQWFNEIIYKRARKLQTSVGEKTRNVETFSRFSKEEKTAQKEAKEKTSLKSSCLT